MITISQLLRSPEIVETVMFHDDDRPVYARLPNGAIHEIDGVSDARIITSAGPSDVIMFAISERTATEETEEEITP